MLLFRDRLALGFSFIFVIVCLLAASTYAQDAGPTVEASEHNTSESAALDERQPRNNRLSNDLQIYSQVYTLLEAQSLPYAIAGFMSNAAVLNYYYRYERLRKAGHAKFFPGSGLPKVVHAEAQSATRWNSTWSNVYEARQSAVVYAVAAAAATVMAFKAPAALATQIFKYLSLGIAIFASGNMVALLAHSADEKKRLKVIPPALSEKLPVLVEGKTQTRGFWQDLYQDRLQGRWHRTANNGSEGEKVYDVSFQLDDHFVVFHGDRYKNEYISFRIDKVVCELIIKGIRGSAASWTYSFGNCQGLNAQDEVKFTTNEKSDMYDTSISNLQDHGLLTVVDTQASAQQPHSLRVRLESQGPSCTKGVYDRPEACSMEYEISTSRPASPVAP